MKDNTIKCLIVLVDVLEYNYGFKFKILTILIEKVNFEKKNHERTKAILLLKSEPRRRL